MDLCASSVMIRSNRPTPKRLSSVSIAWIIVWYVENTSRAVSGLPSSLLSERTHIDALGMSFTNAFFAWSTSSVLSARNSTCSTQLFRLSTSTSDTDTRVLPVPVAITRSPRRCMSLNHSQSDVTAVIW